MLGANAINIDGEEKLITDLTTEDIWRLVFDSESEVCDFYARYARCHGFVSRKDFRSVDANGNVNTRQLVCNKARARHWKYLEKENRQREHRAITRVNCQARIRFIRDGKSGKWKVSAFKSKHNHPCCPLKYRHLIAANRGLDDADKAQADSMRAFGVRTCHIMGYMVGQKGGFDKVGFTQKDLHNHISKTRRDKVKDGDAFAALAYLMSRADNDPLFMGKFTLKDAKLDNLIWADGASIIDYECFGDVLAFDTTYKKNVYNKPLVIFSGTNHHGQTVIFACALLSNEKTESFNWALDAFLEIMSNKLPGAVVTDGDRALKEAISEKFPNIPHRLCAWHLHRNAVQNIKNKQFWSDFNVLLYGQLTSEAFEEKWSDIMLKHGLTDNDWVQGVYNDKTKWATAYLREHFFGKIRTTSQCEGIHSLLKNYVDTKTGLLEFMHKFSEVLRHYRNNELNADFNSFYQSPVLTTCLERFEKQAAEVYTRNIFKVVKEEIEGAGALNVIEVSSIGDIIEYNTSDYSSPHRMFSVSLDKDKDHFSCECRLFETRGIPCSHIFGALRHSNAKCIPESLILKRWTKDVKSDFVSLVGDEELDNDTVHTLRCGAMASICWKLCHISSKNPADFREISSELLKLISKVQKKTDALSTLPQTLKLVGDPVVVKTKGAPKKVPKGQRRRRCQHCKSTKHNIRTCPRIGKKDSINLKDNSSPGFEDELMGETSETNDAVDTQDSAPKNSPTMPSNTNDKKRKGTSSKDPLSSPKATPKRGISGEKSLRKSAEEDTPNEAILEEKTDTQRTEVTIVETTTSNLGWPQYPLHHFPLVHPNQPYPTPFYPKYNGTLPFYYYPSNIGFPPYSQFSHVSPNSSAPGDGNTWVEFLDISKNTKS